MNKIIAARSDHPVWHRAPTHREAYYAIRGKRRLYVEQTVRAVHCAGRFGREFQATIDGVRLGEYDGLLAAQTAAAQAVKRAAGNAAAGRR